MRRQPLTFICRYETVDNSVTISPSDAPKSWISEDVVQWLACQAAIVTESDEPAIDADLFSHGLDRSVLNYCKSSTILTDLSKSSRHTLPSADRSRDAGV
jgi:hypothetical protein